MRQTAVRRTMVQPTAFGLLLLHSLSHCSTQAVYAPLLEDNTKILNVSGLSNVIPSWSDSYSVGDSCYCASTFDHGVGSILVTTPNGTVMTVRQVCDIIGPGPGSANRPNYNDIQCGNGPAYNSSVRASDEIPCPGRTEYGINGCKYIGPKWNFQPFLPPPVSAPSLSSPSSPVNVPSHLSPPISIPSGPASMPTPVASPFSPPVAFPAPTKTGLPIPLAPSPTESTRGIFSFLMGFLDWIFRRLL
jgi:hypothetical protein